MSMPSQERKHLFLNYSACEQKTFPDTEKKWYQGNLSFVTQVSFTLNHPFITGDTTCVEFGGGQHHSAVHTIHESPIISTAEEGASYKGILLLTKEKMVSSVISQKMAETDTEAKSSETGSSLSVNSNNTQANTFHFKKSMNNNRSVCTTRCNTVQSHKGGIRVPSDENALPKLPQMEKPLCSNRKKGFSYITVTARRIAYPNALKAAAASLGNVKNNRKNFLKATAFSVMNSQQHHTIDGHLSDGNQRITCNSIKAFTLKVSNTIVPTGTKEMYYISETSNKDSKDSEGFIINVQKNTLNKKFISCIHHHIPQVFSSNLYYINRSIPFSFTQSTASGKVQRSELSVKIHSNSSKSVGGSICGTCNTGSSHGHTKQGFSTEMTLRNNVKAKSPVTRSEKLLSQQKRVQHLETEPVPDRKFNLNGQPDTKSAAQTFMFAGKERQIISGIDPESIKRENEWNIFVSELYAKKGISRTFSTSAESFGKTPVRKQKNNQYLIFNESKLIGPGYTKKHHGIPNKVYHSEKSTQLNTIPDHLLTLKEALELYRPDFIFRSKERIEKLKLQIQQRRTHQRGGYLQHRAHYGSLPNIPLNSSCKKKQYTVPQPTSDNLFKPRERMISGKEMQMRSKRIYNKLPEVQRRKEEEKKKLVSQTNRLRAEIFKKKLLDQILQRNTDRE